MKTSLFLLLFLLFINCNINETKKKDFLIGDVNSTIAINSKAKRLFNQKCMICHETKGKTRKEMLAPPFYEVKNRYLMVSMDKADFIETMSKWIVNPRLDNSYMREAIDELGLMPKLDYSKHDINLIVNYINKTEFEAPVWLEAHIKKHEDGIEHKH